jgi:Chromosome segregation ATPases
MKKIVFISLVIVAGFFTSCVKNSSEYKSLQAQRDSLALVNAQSTAELDEILSILNEVEENFREIKTAESYISTQSTTPGEMTPSVRERLKSNMQFISETLEKNRQQITDLEQRLKNSNVKSGQLQKTIESLRTQLDEKTETLAILQDDLRRKNYEISKLGENVAALSQNVNELETQSKEQLQIIKQQWSELNTVYYCFGTSKELKEQKILEGGKLGTNFNHAYFTKIPDLNQFHSILLLAKKGKLISNHPQGSYEFVKDGNGKAVLNILDPVNFWSLTKYLVVEVNV